MYQNRIIKGWLGGLLVTAMLLSLLPIFISAMPTEATDSTTALTVTKYDAHGNVISTRTVDYQWMEANLPVQGNGEIRYYCEGATFDPTNLWDPTESAMVHLIDLGCPEGTDVKDLCNLTGGASPGDTIIITGADGYAMSFDYQNVYSPQPRQGKMVICCYNTDFGGYVPAYDAGMRLVFFADNSTNPWGWHVFGDWDMHQTLPESRWYYSYDSGLYSPSSDGLSVKGVSSIDIYEPNLISCDALGNPKENFGPGETVYVKGLGLTAGASYKMWVQDEPVLQRNDQLLLAANDPSGAPELVNTDGNGDFAPLAIWTIGTVNITHRYDIVADRQGAGIMGRCDSADALDSPGWEGFTARPPQTISASAGAGGSISPSGSVSVNYGTSQTFSIMPDANFHIDDVLVDGVSVGAVTSYEFSNVTADHTIAASFAIDTFTIAASTVAHGSITPSGDVTVNYSDNQTFIISPDPVYRVGDVLVDGSSVGAVTSYTFSNVVGNHTIVASFAPAWDLNLDHVCNIGDVVVLGLHWGETGAPGWIIEDLNYDGIINIGDVVVLGLHWGETW